jgi:hypothetical protein
MATTSLTRQSVERLKSRMANMKKEAKEAARQTRNSAMTVVGGAAAGALAAKYPTIGDTEVPTAAALGVALVGLSVTGMLDEYGDEMNGLGSGMLAAVAAQEVQKAIEAKSRG